MLDFACPGCKHKIKVKDDLAGRKGKCPHCGLALTVPTPAGAGSCAHLSDARTVPPPSAMAASGTEGPTQAPKDAEEARRDTRSDADATRGGAPPPSELTDFLAPPQGPGEIGRLGPYRVLKVLGAGGMGVVYQAEDPQLQRLVALKVMLPSLAASASARVRFLREARAAAAVEHDHIVTVYQVGEDRGIPFLAMPLLKGETLDERIKRERRGDVASPLPVAEVLRIGREAAAGLEAARQRGLIHRDIKPANLWLEGESGRVKILDFGLARAGDGEAGLTQQGAILGTPAYMAPEQAGGGADHRSDLFSLGCVLYRMATGRPPFKGSDTISTLMAVATEEPPPPHEVNRRVPRPLSDLVLRLLAKKPEGRPASAQAVVEAIRTIEADPTTVVPPRLPTPAPPSRRSRVTPPLLPPIPVAAKAEPPSKKGRWMLWIGLFALLLLAAVGGGGAFLLMHPVPGFPSPFGPDPRAQDNPLQHSDGGEDGWQSLFNGHDLAGWIVPKGKAGNWGVEDGVLFTRGENRNWLLTEKEYGDFEVRLQYQLPLRGFGGGAAGAPALSNSGGNSGVGLRAPLDKESSIAGLEIQILDDEAYLDAPRKELNGALYQFIPPSRHPAHPAGEWNKMLISARGRKVTVDVNDLRVLDADLETLKDQAVKFPGLAAVKGRIGLKSHTGRVEFRELFVRPLAPLPPAKGGGKSP